MSELQEAFGDLDLQWGGVEAAANTGGPLPDGVYPAFIHEVKLSPSREPGARPRIEWAFEVAMGDYEGKTVRNWSQLETAQNQAYFKRDLQTLGIQKERLTEAIEELMTHTGQLVEIKVKTSKGRTGDKTFTNVYIQKTLEGLGDGLDEESRMMGADPF